MSSSHCYPIPPAAMIQPKFTALCERGVGWARLFPAVIFLIVILIVVLICFPFADLQTHEMLLFGSHGCFIGIEQNE
jgi:hypothetical protein